MIDYPRNPPGLIWDGWMFNAQIEAARKRAMQAPQPITVAARVMTPQQKQQYNRDREARRG